MKGRFWALLGLTLGFIVVLIPYLFLRDVASYWANYLYWLIVTLVVLAVGIWKVKRWGD